MGCASRLSCFSICTLQNCRFYRCQTDGSKVLDCAGVEYVRFTKLIAGLNGANVFPLLGVLRQLPSDLQHAHWAHMCASSNYQRLRDTAYAKFGINRVRAAALPPHVLIIDGAPGERRHLKNISAVQDDLQLRFPGATFEYQVISQLSAAEQLYRLSNATVLVSNIGSRSFRLIFLQDGASVILVGPPDDGSARRGRPRTIPTPFLELHWCWAYLDYVRILPYHVKRHEYTEPEERGNRFFHLRNSDTIVKSSRLGPLLDHAMVSSLLGRT